MARIVDYASLVQGILDFTHRPGLSAFVDYLIQGAQEQIANDILEQNFGKGIRLMEAAYGPTTIGADGTASVPSDWIAPKLFTLSTDDDEFDLIFKDPQWIYSRYPERAATGIPAYIARDIYAPSGAPSGLAPSLSFTATAGQTVFSLAALSAAVVVLVSINGIALTPTVDYNISGSTLTLTTDAHLNQTVLVQAIPASASLTNAGNQVFTASAGQTQFTLAAPGGSLILFAALNGVVLQPTVDYSLSGATFTLTHGAAAGETLLVRYLSTGSISGTLVFIFGPYPDDEYSISGTYYQTPPDLTSSQTTNWLVLNAPSLLHAACMAEAGKFLKDVQMVEGWMQIYSGKLESFLARDTAERYGAGPLVINASWMSSPFIITFGPWMPDGADIAFMAAYQGGATSPLADCLNVYFSQGAYRSLPTPAEIANIGAQCIGAFTAPVDRYAAAGADLYRWTGSAWSAISKSAGAYAGAAHWSFTAFGGCAIATDGIHPLQDRTDAAGGGNFADIAAAPIGNVLGVINQSLFVGSLAGFPYRVQCSGIGDPTSWPTPLTDAAVAAESIQVDLDQQFGEVLFIGGGPQMGTFLQRNGITRATYQGGDTVFAFLPVERKRGVIARGAAVQAGDVTHYISDSGFYATDGSGASTPTGTTQSAALDKWFLSNVNWDAVSSIQSAWDASLKCVVYAIPTGSNTLPDTLLLLNPQSGQWTKASVPLEFLWTDLAAEGHRLAAFDQSHNFSIFTGAPASGYCETYDVAFVDAQVRHISEAQPHIICTDSPTMRVAAKEAADDATVYTADIARDSFTKTCAFDTLPGGKFVRARLTSAAASAISGATLYLEQGGGV